MDKKQREKERYNYRKTNGLCTKCGKPAFRGKTLCAECREKAQVRDTRYKTENKDELARKKKERYNYRKDNMLCVRCGNNVSNGVFCDKCKDSENEKRRNDRKFYQNLGICPICKKEPIYLNEKVCFDCNEKAYAFNSKRSKDVNRLYAKKRRLRLISIGLCTNCGKREATAGYKQCEYCRCKNRERMLKGHIPRCERAKYGLCYFCGEKVIDGKNVCENHYKTCLNNLTIAIENSNTDNHFWRKDEMIRYASMRKQ